LDKGDVNGVLDFIIVNDLPVITSFQVLDLIVQRSFGEAGYLKRKKAREALAPVETVFEMKPETSGPNALMSFVRRVAKGRHKHGKSK